MEAILTVDTNAHLTDLHQCCRTGQRRCRVTAAWRLQLSTIAALVGTQSLVRGQRGRRPTLPANARTSRLANMQRVARRAAAAGAEEPHHRDQHAPRSQHNFEYFIGRELAARGYRPWDQLLRAEETIEEFLPAVAAAVRYARTVPGVGKSCSPPTAARSRAHLYEEIAENGPSACQVPRDSTHAAQQPHRSAEVDGFCCSTSNRAPHRMISSIPPSTPPARKRSRRWTCTRRTTATTLRPTRHPTSGVRHAVLRRAPHAQRASHREAKGKLRRSRPARGLTRTTTIRGPRAWPSDLARSRLAPGRHG